MEVEIALAKAAMITRSASPGHANGRRRLERPARGLRHPRRSAGRLEAASADPTGGRGGAGARLPQRLDRLAERRLPTAALRRRRRLSGDARAVVNLAERAANLDFRFARPSTSWPRPSEFGPRHG